MPEGSECQPEGVKVGRKGLKGQRDPKEMMANQDPKETMADQDLK